MDFFTVPTLTFGILYCFFIIGHDRCRILQNIISGAGKCREQRRTGFQVLAKQLTETETLNARDRGRKRSSTSDWLASYGAGGAEEPSGAQCTALSAA